MLSLAALRRGDHNIWSSNAIFLTGFGSSPQTPDSLLTATTLPPSCACSQVPLKDKDKDKEKDKKRYKDTNIMTLPLSLFFFCDMRMIFTLSTWELHSLCLQHQFLNGRPLSIRNWSQWSNLSSPDGHNLKMIYILLLVYLKSMSKRLKAQYDQDQDHPSARVTKLIAQLSWLVLFPLIFAFVICFITNTKVRIRKNTEGQVAKDCLIKDAHCSKTDVTWKLDESIKNIGTTLMACFVCTCKYTFVTFSEKKVQALSVTQIHFGKI